MQRNIPLNPKNFVDVLVSGGLQLGKSNADLQCVINPERLGLRSVIRMGKPLEAENWTAHLQNLGISEAQFEKWFDNYRPPLLT